MRILQLVICSGLVMGLSTWALAQEEDTDETAQPQATAVVVVQKPVSTKIETFEQTPGSIITKGLTRVGNISSDESAEIDLNVVCMKDQSEKKIYGLQLEIIPKESRSVRSYIDEEDIAPLIDALGKLSHVDKNSLPMELVEASYRTHGNVEIINRDVNGGRVAIIRMACFSPLTGQIHTARASFRAARLMDIIQQLNQAKGVISRLKE